MKNRNQSHAHNYLLPSIMGKAFSFFGKNGILRNPLSGIPASSELRSKPLSVGNRIESIDLLRGIVMIIMALDHVRIYFFAETFVFNAMDLQRTTPLIFATRLITHLCAPTFILLAGTSVYFIAQRKTRKETSLFLLSRGAWLIFLQLTIVQFAWHFDPAFHHITSNIISTIGFCMIFLALVIHLKIRSILIVGLVIVCGHNMLDQVSFRDGSALDIVWSFLHVSKLYPLANDYSLQFNYPVIPWVGVIALGYCLGRLFDTDFSTQERRKILLGIGVMCLVVFVTLRSTNIYGDLHPWSAQETMSKTIMSFFKLEKYPPSLLYLCFTLGISVLLLAWMEGKSLEKLKPITLFGKVALFYYVLHIFLIHALALIGVMAYGFPWQSMIFFGAPNQSSPILKGHYGFSLSETYLIWIGVVVLLYPLCTYWDSFKHRHKKKWWVSYV